MSNQSSKIAVNRRDARFVLSVFLFLCSPLAAVQAHPEGFSGMHVTIGSDRIRAAITVHTRDMSAWFPPGKYSDYVADITREMEETVDQIIEIQIEGQPQPIESVKAFQVEIGLIEIDVDYRLPNAGGPVELLVWSKHLIWLPRGHQQLLFVEDVRQVPREQVASNADQGQMLLDDLLTVDRDAAAVMVHPAAAESPGSTVESAVSRDLLTESDDDPLDRDTDRDTDVGQGAAIRADSSRQPKAAPTVDRPTFRISFFLFGVEHIMTGYDHLLFLAALLLACATFGEAATIITCFTIAHSITLAMAALDIVRLSGAIVEPLIALSIVYVAVENLWGSPTLRRRASITGFFGLIHGLGFASALRDIGLGTLPGGVVLPLLRFNLGVEAGQLCVAAILLPLLLWAKRNERVSRVLVPVGSGLVALIGAYWLLTRVLLH